MKKKSKKDIECDESFIFIYKKPLLIENRGFVS